MPPSASFHNSLSISVKQETPATNTLLITNLNRRTFLSEETLAELRSQLEEYGEIYKFVPMKCFNRILAVFYQTTDAKVAKTNLDRAIFLKNTLRIYYGMYTPIRDKNHDSQHLHVPQIEKNWLISPPGSPPLEWVQIREDAPNSNTFAKDLVHALSNVALHNSSRDFEDLVDDDSDELLGFSLEDDNKKQPFTHTKLQVPILTVISGDNGTLGNGGDTSVPTIIIQDWDHNSSPTTTSANSNSVDLRIQSKAHISLADRPCTPTPTSRPSIIL
ncbi:hypothetical protein G9A89_019729 [Geosiphon pyriformis]|nr:hypothetical protein G9A89_019729 [Geosiphon pyriformis]